MTDVLIKIYKGPKGDKGDTGTWPPPVYRLLDSGTNHTLVLDEERSYLDIPATSSIVSVTIPNASDVALPLGSTVRVAAQKAGDVAILRASGVTLLQQGSSPFGNADGVVNKSVVKLTKILTNVWIQE
jgi:hypothetical protein